MDNNNKVRIKCPCGANLVLTKTPGMESKTFTCPVCHQPHPFTEYTVLPPLQPQPAATPQPQTVDVICPCGAKLRIKRAPGIESKTLTCPKCGTRRPFTQYRDPKDITPNPPTDEGGGGGGVPGGTVVAGAESASLPYLLDTASGKTYSLNEGDNIVGRGADSSKADIKIVTTDKKLSREHFVITCKKVGAGFKFFIRLYKKEVNTTKVSNELLSFGDEIVIQNGAKITVNQTTLQFVVPDIQSTIY